MRIVFGLIATCLALSAQVKLPPYSQKALDNGVVLQLLPKSDVPMITLSAIVRGGAEADPPEKAGLASLTAEMLRRGSGDRTADQFSEDLDFIGASFSTGVDEQASYITMEFLAKDLDTALDLFSTAILEPRFPKAEADKLVKQRIDAVRSSKDQPSGLTSRYFRPHFFPHGHPYARQVSGDELTLARIGLDDIEQYHRRFYPGRNLIVTAAGDFDEAVLGKRLTAVFGSVRAGERYEWAKQVPAVDHERTRLLLADKPGATQTYFLIGWPGIHRTHPDRIPMILIDTLFGGRFTSLLNDTLRVREGLTYGAYSRMQRDRLPGMLAIDTFTAIETTEKAIDMALDILRRLRADGIDAGQLASAKAYVKGRYPTRTVETARQLAGVLGDLALFELNRDEIDRYFERIDAVSLEEANAAIKRHYRTENLQFVLVGDASKIRETVSKYADDMKVIPVSEAGFGGE